VASAQKSSLPPISHVIMKWHENVAFALQGCIIQGTSLAAHHVKQNTAKALEIFNIRPVFQPTQQ
jgi:hypothetical protein